MFENEKIVETRICKHCGVAFDITDKDLEFYEKVSPVFQRPVSLKETGLNGEKSPDSKKESGLKKYLIPSPTLCPHCREQRRMTWRNERKIYKRKCDFSEKDIISIYSSDKFYKVYDQEIWWSDKWDALDYGRDFDFSKSFFEQFGELMKEVPRMSIFGKNNENNFYTNHTDGAKDSYMTIDTANSQNICYSKWIVNSINSIDCYFIDKSELCYECMNIDNCYKCFYSYYSNNCKNCSYIYFCDNCNNCLFCTNLKNKKYYILNKAYNENEYNKLSKEIFAKNNPGEYFQEFLKNQIRKPTFIYNSENVLGDFIWNSSNVFNSFTIIDGEKLKYCHDSGWINNSYDVYEAAFECNFQYECHACNRGKNTLGGHVSYDIYNCFYIDSCHNSSHLFGCIGLKNKSYCILNKQYTKSEYEKLVPKIIENMMTPPQSPSIEGEARNEQGEQEWGEFFPSSLSPFGYNETVAQEYYPLESSELSVISQETDTFKVCKLKTGNGKLKINWSDYEAPFPKVDKIIPANKLPENIADIPDDILNWAIECEITKKPFRIIKEELEFYRKHNLPIPRRHPDQRHLDRMSLRNPRKLFERICDCPNCEENHKNIGKYKEEEFEINIKTGKKGKKIQTTYAPERPEIVYCEECYNREIY